MFILLTKKNRRLRRALHNISKQTYMFKSIERWAMINTAAMIMKIRALLRPSLNMIITHTRTFQNFSRWSYFFSVAKIFLVKLNTGSRSSYVENITVFLPKIFSKKISVKKNLPRFYFSQTSFYRESRWFYRKKKHWYSGFIVVPCRFFLLRLAWI